MDQRQNRSDLRAFFEPQSIAAVGSMREAIGNAYNLINNLLTMGFSGPIYPINPNPSKYGEVFGLKVYASVEDVPDPIDLAILLVPPETTPKTVGECARKGVRAAIVLSEGFAEASEEGASYQAQLEEIAKRTGLRIMGPNTFGTVNTYAGLATIAPYLGDVDLRRGGVSVCSQTGSTGPHMMPLRDWAYPISKMCDIGNKCDVNETDILNYLADDPETDVVAMHLEDIRNGAQFMEAARRLVSRKPLIVLKTGRTEAGAKASASHTGSMMGSDRIYDAALQQVGAIRANSWQELWETPKSLTKQPLPSGNRFAIITVTGGQGVIAVDAAAEAGLEVAKFSPSTIRSLKNVSPRLGDNPVDIGPVISDSRTQSSSNPFSVMQEVVSIVLKDPCVDCLTITVATSKLVASLIPMTVNVIREMVQEADKTVNIWITGSSLETEQELARQLNKIGIPAYFDLDMAIKALGNAARYSGHRDKLRNEQDLRTALAPRITTNIIDRASNEGRTVLTELESKQLVASVGIPVIESQLVSTKAQAIGASKRIGFPVAMKIVSPDIIHKTESGGVRLGIPNATKAGIAYTQILSATKNSNPKARIDGISVQKMANDGIEVIMGASKDPTFGPVLMFGLGGVFVEVLDDVVFRVAPISRQDAYDMIRTTKGFPLLEGYRGQEPVNLKALEDILMKLSYLVEKTPQIKELDLNPVLACKDGAMVLDARILLEN